MTTMHQQEPGVVEPPVASPNQQPHGVPSLVVPIFFGLLGAWWASNKAAKLGITDTGRYWKAAVISTFVSLVAAVLVPIALFGALGLALNSGGTTLNDPSAVSPLNNTGGVPGAQSAESPAPRLSAGPLPGGVTNDASTATLYGFHPAKNDLAGPSGAVVWSVKARAWCFITQNVACLSQLYSTHGPSYDRDVTLVSAGNASNGPENWGATNIVVTKQSDDHFTATFDPTNSDPSEVGKRIIGSYTWAPSLSVWLPDVLAQLH